MNAAPKRMSVADYLAWARGPEAESAGRSELLGGVIVAMAPETAAHVRVKGDAYFAFRTAIARAGLGCEAITDGATLVIDQWTAYEPDLTVQCGAPIDNRSLVADAPVIVVEVLSPSNTAAEMARKLRGYLRLPSVRHVLIVDPEDESAALHSRDAEGAILTRFVADGALRFDPPGLEIELAALFTGVRAAKRAEA